MGRLQDKIIASFIGDTKTRKNKKKVIVSIVSLVLAFVVLLTSTYCWYSINKANMSTGSVTLNTGKGLRSNDLGEEIRNIQRDAKLRPASSVDGRNIFFPADGTDFKSRTAEITYRSANVGDKNFDYIQLDITLTADADYTTIYIDTDGTYLRVLPDTANGFSVKQAESCTKALRSALWYEGVNDGSNKPIVFTTQNATSTDTAIEQINRSTGAYLKLGRQVAVPFKDYAFGKRQIATLNAGQSLNLKYIVWLEGDSRYCTNALEGRQIDFGLSFTTSWDNLETIYFVDQTGTPPREKAQPTENGAVTNAVNSTDNNGRKLSLNYNNDTQNVHMDFNMYRYVDSGGEVVDGIWYCKIPGNAYQDITFTVSNNDGSGDIYVFETNDNGTSTKNRGESTVYIATSIANQGTAAHGYWYDGEIEDKGIGKDEDILDDDDW